MMKDCPSTRFCATVVLLGSAAPSAVVLQWGFCEPVVFRRQPKKQLAAEKVAEKHKEENHTK